MGCDFLIEDSYPFAYRPGLLLSEIQNDFFPRGDHKDRDLRILPRKSERRLQAVLREKADAVKIIEPGCIFPPSAHVTIVGERVADHFRKAFPGEGILRLGIRNGNALSGFGHRPYIHGEAVGMGLTEGPYAFGKRLYIGLLGHRPPGCPAGLEQRESGEGQDNDEKREDVFPHRLQIWQMPLYPGGGAVLLQLGPEGIE